jgi:type VI secretion system protein ImpA
MSRQLQSLSEPLAATPPCGVSLEDSPLLASFDVYRLFGQVSAIEPPPDWGQIKAKSAEALATSKDLRVLTHLAAAVLRTDGIQVFFEAVCAAADWLENFWAAVYPLIDEDALLRRNALNCFADRVAVIDALRRGALITHPRLGAVSVRDVDIASGQLTAPESETRHPDETQINAIFAGSPVEELTGLLTSVDEALGAVRRIETLMVEHAGVEAAPALEPLTAYLTRAQKIIRDRIATHPDAARAGPEASTGNGADHSGAPDASRPLGSIRSREDAIRALDAVAAYFRQSEPSSPIPLIVERARRLVSKDFLEVLADLAPDAIAQAKSASGVRDS